MWQSVVGGSLGEKRMHELDMLQVTYIIYLKLSQHSFLISYTPSFQSQNRKIRGNFKASNTVWDSVQGQVARMQASQALSRSSSFFSLPSGLASTHLSHSPLHPLSLSGLVLQLLNNSIYFPGHCTLLMTMWLSALC